LLHRQGLVSFPLTTQAKEKVEAIVANITSTYYGREIYATIEEKIVAYLYFLIKDHPFIDGNKRTASLVFSILCELNDVSPRFGNLNPTLDELAVFIEKIQEDDHQSVIQQIAVLLF
jgi:death-on-curing family protein